MKTFSENIEILSLGILNKYPVILDKIIVATGKGKKESIEVFEEVLRYLFVCSESEEKISPSRIVDLAWHEFVLHTFAYHEFCNKHLKKFVHHIPGREKPSIDKFNETVEKIDKAFNGNVKRNYWPEINDVSLHCDGNPNCESCGGSTIGM